MKCDMVIANPPFSLDKWGKEIAAVQQGIEKIEANLAKSQAKMEGYLKDLGF